MDDKFLSVDGTVVEGQGIVIAHLDVEPPFSMPYTSGVGLALVSPTGLSFPDQLRRCEGQCAAAPGIPNGFRGRGSLKIGSKETKCFDIGKIRTNDFG